MASATDTIEFETLPSLAPQSEVTAVPSGRKLQAAEVSQSPETEIKRSRVLIIFFQLTAVIYLTSLSTGLINISVPQMAKDLGIGPELYFCLTSGSCLLLAGSVADAIGSRPVYLTGALFLGVFVLGSGLSQTGIQLIMFRAMQGIGSALCMPTSISILTDVVPAGKTRNVGFSCLGMAQVLGFASGLVISGVLTDTIGWRAGWYICGGTNLLLFLIGIWSIPPGSETRSLKKLKTDVDWIGAVLATASLSLLAYTLVMLSSRPSSIKNGANIATLVTSIVVGAAFFVWMHRQERAGKPALVPNSLWKQMSFSSICIMVLLSYAVLQIMELYCSLFWHEVQDLSEMQTSLRFLPSMVVAGVMNLGTGLLIHRIPLIWLVTITSVFSATAPMIMALIDPSWPYWYAAFPAQVLQPFSPDVLFTVGVVITTSAFPVSTQALAGAVFNTVAQFGQAIGLALTGVIAETVTQAARDDAGPSMSEDVRKDITMEGYRAAFWTCVAAMGTCFVIGIIGLRGAGKVGMKRE